MRLVLINQVFSHLKLRSSGSKQTESQFIDRLQMVKKMGFFTS